MQTTGPRAGQPSIAHLPDLSAEPYENQSPKHSQIRWSRCIFRMHHTHSNYKVTSATQREWLPEVLVWGWEWLPEASEEHSNRSHR
jgi:hypothetical protein